MVTRGLVVGLVGLVVDVMLVAVAQNEMVGQVDAVDGQVKVLRQAQVQNPQTEWISFSLRHHLPQQSLLGIGLATFGIGEGLHIVQDVVQDAHLFERRQLFVEFQPNVALQLLIICPQLVHVQQRIGRFVYPQSPLPRALGARIKPISEPVVHEGPMQTVHQLIHASLVFFTSGMGLA